MPICPITSNVNSIPVKHGFVKSKHSTVFRTTSELVYLQRHVYDTGFDLCGTFDLIPRTLLLDKPIVNGLSDSYVILLCSYITTHYYLFESAVIFSTPFEILLAVPQWSVLGPVLSNLFNHDIFSSIKYSRYTYFFVDDIKIVRTVSSATDCIHPQFATDSISDPYAARLMKFYTDKTEFTTFTTKITKLTISTNCVTNVWIAPDPSQT